MAFIKQEAMEKAREIKIKADEEFAIEKVCPLVSVHFFVKMACYHLGETCEAGNERY